MKGILHIRSGVLFIGIMSLLLALKIGMAHLFIINRCSVAIDPLFSPSVATAIKNSLTQMSHDTFPSAHKVIADLKKQYPSVQSLSAQRIAPDVLYYEVTAETPLMAVNKDFILTTSGLLVSRDLFALHRLRSLYSIEISSKIAAEAYIESPLLLGIKKLPSYVLSHYKIVVKDRFHVELEDKQQPFISILCLLDQIPSMELLQQCKQCVCKKLARETKQTKSKEKEPGRIIADVRFNKQIIIYAGQGG